MEYKRGIFERFRGTAFKTFAGDARRAKESGI